MHINSGGISCTISAQRNSAALVAPAHVSSALKCATLVLTMLLNLPQVVQRACKLTYRWQGTAHIRGLASRLAQDELQGAHHQRRQGARHQQIPPSPWNAAYC